MQMKGKDSNKHRKIQAILDQSTTTNTTTGNPTLPNTRRRRRHRTAVDVAILITFDKVNIQIIVNASQLLELDSQNVHSWISHVISLLSEFHFRKRFRLIFMMAPTLSS